MAKIDRLAELAARGLIRPETANPEWQDDAAPQGKPSETEDPDADDAVLAVAAPSREQVTAAEERNRLAPELGAAIQQQRQQQGIDERNLRPIQRWDAPPGEGVAAPVAAPGPAALAGPAGIRPGGVVLPGGGALRRGRERIAELGSAYDAQAEAIEQRAAIDARRAARRDEFLAKNQIEMARLQEREQQQEATRQRAVKDMREQVAQAEEDARYRIPPEERAEHEAVIGSQFTTGAQKNRARLALQQAQKVDPQEAFPTVGQKIAAVIAMGLGGFAAGTRGGPNHVANMLQKHIDQSVRAQQTAFERNRKALIAKRGGYADMRNRFKDERVAELATRNRMLDDAKRYMDSIAISQGGPEAKARAAELAATLDQKKVLAQDEMDRHASDFALRRSLQQEQARSTRAALGARERQAQAKAQEQSFAMPGFVETGEVPVPKDPKSRGAIREAWASWKRGHGALDRALELQEEYSGLPYTEGAARGEIAQSELVMLWKNIDKAGALGEGEREFYKDLIGKIPNLNPNQIARLDELRARLDRETSATMQSFGLGVDPAAAKAQQEAEDPDRGVPGIGRDVPIGEDAD